MRTRILVLLLAAWSVGATEFYVAVDGDDANPGTPAQPFATMEAARDAIRALKPAGPLAAPVTVYVRGGVYPRAVSFVLTAEDSGTAVAPITYCAYGDETARLVGGEMLDPEWFLPVDDTTILDRLDPAVRDAVRQVDLIAHGITAFGELAGLAGGLAIFHKGQRLPLARWPDAGWAEARSASTVDLDCEAAERMARGHRLGPVAAFRYEGAAPRSPYRLDEVWLRGIWQQEYWFEAWHPAGFDREACRIAMPFDLFPALSNWRRFYIANALEELTTPGEWFLDRAHGVLYVLPPEDSGASPDYCVSMLGDTMIAISDCRNVTIRGLVLETMRGQALSISGGRDTRIAGCVIRGARQAASVSGTHNGVDGCDIYDLEGMGILLSGGDRKTLAPGGLYAVNNHIHDYAQLLKNWQPAIRVQGVGQRVAHNRIHHAPQYGISYEGNDHVFEFNELHDLDLEMSDVGVIGCGTDWTCRGNVIRHNFIHDIPERPYPGVVSVYFDNCASSGETYGNVFYRMTKAILIGGGRDHVIHNNVFIECETPVSLDNRGLRWGHFQPGGPMYADLDEVDHDGPPWSSRYPELARILNECPQAPLGNVLVRNVSVRSGWTNPEEVCRRTFAKNIDTPYLQVEDNFVTDQDPGFVDVAAMNFALRDDSVVYKAIPGFRPIPFDRIGLYPDPCRARRP
ncbi:MAG TPA: right-handed parallel beta-helix repeat-containing protein [Candidatus Hydrogenedentes bacterium]|nr:right-handed parallel beta-helix repeat-containing protein [Candidatus Hydrogenedentota bacterium]HPG69378.1 right-handed parallel beta-helix repeat-containing protein [Candidatus Hydrogenedentota bacterium]